MDGNISVDDQFNTEYRLLREYYSRRKPKTRGRHAAAAVEMFSADRNMRKCKKLECSLEADRSWIKKLECSLKHECPVNTDEMGDVAENLAKIVDSSSLVPNEFESDSGENIIQRLVELLKESGDELNDKIKKDCELVGYLQSSFSYSVFEKLASTFIGSAVSSQRQNQDVCEQKSQIAWTFEMTSRLTALDLHPMNRAMGFGAQYLHHNFAQWIQQHGGWERVFNRDENDDDDDDDDDE